MLMRTPAEVAADAIAAASRELAQRRSVGQGDAGFAIPEPPKRLSAAMGVKLLKLSMFRTMLGD